MHDLFSHLRTAVRQLRRSPGFALTAILTLAIGIGATTAIFSIFYAVLLRPLPYPQPDRLVEISALESVPGSTATNTNEISYPNFRDWRDQAHSFESMASYHPNTLVLNAAGPNAARNLQIGVVSSDFFHVLGMQPALGRTFRRDEERAGAHVVILSHELWVSAYHASPAILGASVKLSDENYTVVGVLPANASFPFFASSLMDLWTTPAVDAVGKNPSTEQRGWTQLATIARLRDGVSIAQATAEMNTIAASLAKQYPDDDARETAVEIKPTLENMIGDVRGPLRILLTAVAALLLIACANVAGLLLARGSSRQTELAVRAALGASRREITLQLLVESLILSLAGGAAGILIAAAALKGILYFVPKNLPRLDTIAINGPVFAFAIGVSMLTGIIFGLLPALRLSRLNPAMALQDSARTSSAGRKQSRMHSFLVIAETAIGLVLLIGAGLLIHSFLRMLSTDPGFNTGHALTFRIGTTDKAYPEQKRTQFYADVIERLEALPGAQSATAAFPLPFSGGNMSISFDIEGRPSRPGDQPTARDSLVYPGYFKTLQIPLRRGRVMSELDNREEAPPIVVINESLAAQYFPGEDPIGKRIATGFDQDDSGKTIHWREIVGVVGNVKRFNVTEDPHPEYYVPFAQAPVTMPYVALRVSGDAAAYEQSVTRAVAGLDKEVPVYRFRTVAEGVAIASAQPRFQTLLLTAFAAVALLLAAIGLYAVLSYMVAQRTHELGLRMALGAQRGSVLALVMRRGLDLACIGLAIGAVASLLLSRFIASLLYGVHAFDAITYLSAAAVLLLVSALASLLPAARAASLEPMRTLRSQ
jgi:putative ABC transport system permease protein